MNEYLCAGKGCLEATSGIYCDSHRGVLDSRREAIKAEKSERFKKLRATPEFKKKLAASREPAKE